MDDVVQTERSRGKKESIVMTAHIGTPTAASSVSDEPILVDRRSSSRTRTLITDAWLGWQVAGHPFETTATLLLDYSERGALLVVDRLPPIRIRAWLGLERPVYPSGIEVHRIHETTTRQGPHVLRVAFTSICPRSVFDVVNNAR